MKAINATRGYATEGRAKTLVFALIATIVASMVLTAMPAKTYAAAYNNTSAPPACSSVSIPYSVSQLLENVTSANKDALLAAYNSNAAYYFVSKQFSSAPYRRWAIYVFNYYGDSTAIDGIRSPASSPYYFAVNMPTNAKYWTAYGDFKDDNVTIDKAKSVYGVTETTTNANALTNPPTTIFGALNDSYANDCVISTNHLYNTTGITYLTKDGFEQSIDPEESNFWTSLTNGIGNIWDWLQNFPDMVVALFVPNTNTLSSMINDDKEFYEEKFGLLLYPFQFMYDYFSAFNQPAQSPWNYCQAVPDGNYNHDTAWSFGDLFGSPVTIDGCAFEKVVGHSGMIWFRTILQGITVILLVGTIMRKYKETISR